MLFQLKKRKTNNNLNSVRFKKFKSILCKATFVAKNVIYIKKFSKKKMPKGHKKKNKIEFAFKNFFLTTIKAPHPLLQNVQELRYKSFFGRAENKEKKDIDEFDKVCEHLVVVDRSVSENFVVGTYRLLLKQKNAVHRKFYTESEFNIENLYKNENVSILEAGRSCVHEDYRDGRIIKLLWKGLATYIFENDVDYIFGCASFPSSNYSEFVGQLSYLHNNHLAPPIYSTTPKDLIKANYKVLDSKKINNDKEFRNLPPLIKAYLRAGAWIGKGAVVDKKFDTTDVLIILKSTNIMKKYSQLSFRKDNY